MRRATQTAAIIGTVLGLEPVVVENFRETNVGDLELRPPSAEAWAVNETVTSAWAEGRWNVRFPGGENYHELCARMLLGLEGIIGTGEGGPILVVGHGGGFGAVLPVLCPGLDSTALPRDNHNCAITELLAGRDAEGRLAAQLVRYANYSHLSGEAAQVISGLPDENTFRADK